MNQFYSASHYRTVSPSRDTANTIAERGAWRDAMVKVQDEHKKRFPVVDSSNFAQAADCLSEMMAQARAALAKVKGK